MTNHNLAAAHPSQDRGAIAVYCAIVLVLVIGFGGLALDTAFVRLTTRQLQNAADAAALAAVQQILSDSEATQFATTRTAAVTVAAANEADQAAVQLDSNPGNGATGDVVVGTWDKATRTFTPTTSSPDAVQVTARRTSGSAGGPVELLFGRVFGATDSELARTAVAHLRSTQGPAVILVLHPTSRKAFQLRGTPFIEAPDGQIQVNSTHQVNAFYINGAPDDPRVRAQQINVVGGASYPSGSVLPPPIEGADPVPDPLAGLPYPDTASMTNHGGITGGGNYTPGYYPDGAEFNNGTANLSPGVYVFGPPGIDLQGSGKILGDEVMFFLEVGARVNISGNDPGLAITAPSSGTYQGVSIFAHRDSALDFVIGGSGIFDVAGTMYMAKGHLEMHGTVDRRIGRIVIYTQLLRGTGLYTITGEGPPTGLPLYPYLVK